MKLLLKFFLNPENKAYLRSLESEFGESTNGIRLELNKLEQADMLTHNFEGNKKVYQVNTSHPLYSDINSIVRKYVGIDSFVEQALQKLIGIQKIFLIGNLARGLNSDVLEVVLIGDVEQRHLPGLTKKIETVMKRKVVYTVCSSQTECSEILRDNAHLLLWSGNSKTNING